MRTADALRLTKTVAESLLRWRYVEESVLLPGELWGYRGEPWEKKRVPDYARDWGAVHEVVVCAENLGHLLYVHHEEREWRVRFRPVGMAISWARLTGPYSTGETFPAAVCCAALSLAGRLGLLPDGAKL